MPRYPRYTRDRIRQVSDRVGALVYQETQAPDAILVGPRVDRIPYDEAVALDYRPARMGEQFGPLWATYWFRVEATVPAAWAGSRVDLLWVTGSESTLWIDGRSAQGLNTGTTGERPDALVTERALGGERLELWLETACNGTFGFVAPRIGGGEPVVLERCELARFDAEAWTLWLDLQLLRDLEAEHQRLDPAWAGRLLSELNRFCNVWSESDRETWATARKILAGLLASRNGTVAHELSAVGHAHIDTAWLWPLGESYRKCVRTFSSQTSYMDRYPEFRFACSQAQQYAWIKERNPELWRRIVECVERGQWVPVGGTWVEPDCNLPSGESLVRQLLYGQRFFELELGRRCTELWQPDVFGYNGQLPQLMRGAGITRFLTQKLSWNRFNPPEHHTFTWQGIDGSEVLAHFPPADTYNAEASVADLVRNVRNFKDHDRSRESLILFGWGDGGGGPTPKMIETLRRVRDLQGLPRTAMRTSEEFFERLEAAAAELPTLVGELYFEYHRGTYTSQAAVKRANRRSEELLHDVELAAAIADRLGLAPYPADELRRVWERVLLNQFHDILPGSSIADVYAEAGRDYTWIDGEGRRLRAAALGALCGDGGPAPVNTLGFSRREVVEDPGGTLVVVGCPSCGVGVMAEPADSVTVAVDGSRFLLENGQLAAVLSCGGDLLSLVEKATGREALGGSGNRLELYDDRPTAFDAWDVDPFHLETGRVCAPAGRAELAANGPLRAEVAFAREIGAASSMRQTVRLDAEARRLEFHTEIEWAEDHRLLKVAFPVAVRARTATYEMQFGVAERPTHRSTSREFAQYEVPGHRFADVSEPGFGVALLSESKYGFSTLDGTLRMSLLRAPSSPDPRADRGWHCFVYALLPHAGGWREAGVVAEARRFNHALCWGSGPSRSFASVDDPGLVLDTVKRAEDSDALVVRLYEAHGARGMARLTLDIPFESASYCNLLEDELAPARVDGREIEIPYGPFEIVSLKVT